MNILKVTAKRGLELRDGMHNVYVQTVLGYIKGE